MGSSSGLAFLRSLRHRDIRLFSGRCAGRGKSLSQDHHKIAAVGAADLEFVLGVCVDIKHRTSAHTDGSDGVGHRIWV